MECIALKLFFGCLLSFLVTYYFIPIFIAIAYKCTIVDHPDGTIKMHESPTPYLGGAAVYMGFLAALGLVFPFDNRFFQFLIGSTLLFYLGLIDDMMPFRPIGKLVGQAIAVLCFLKAGFYLKAHIFYNFWNIGLSALWMLIVINAFNLIDVMDGLATIVALFCATTFLCIALLGQQYLVALLLCVMIGALLAFFLFNAPKASIYLGDAGSLFIGGFFSTVPFLFDWGVLTEYGYLIPVIILGIPLLELTSLVIIRTYKSIPFYAASPDHFALYLKKKGLSSTSILLFVSLLSLVIMAASILFAQQIISVATVLAIGILFVITWLYCIF